MQLFTTGTPPPKKNPPPPPQKTTNKHTKNRIIYLEIDHKTFYICS